MSDDEIDLSELINDPEVAAQMAALTGGGDVGGDGIDGDEEDDPEVRALMKQAYMEAHGMKGGGAGGGAAVDPETAMLQEMGLASNLSPEAQAFISQTSPILTTLRNKCAEARKTGDQLKLKYYTDEAKVLMSELAAVRGGKPPTGMAEAGAKRRATWQRQYKFQALQRALKDSREEKRLLHASLCNKIRNPAILPTDRAAMVESTQALVQEVARLDRISQAISALWSKGADCPTWNFNEYEETETCYNEDVPVNTIQITLMSIRNLRNSKGAVEKASSDGFSIAYVFPFPNDAKPMSINRIAGIKLDADGCAKNASLAGTEADTPDLLGPPNIKQPAVSFPYKMKDIKVGGLKDGEIKRLERVPLFVEVTKTVSGFLGIGSKTSVVAVGAASLEGLNVSSSMLVTVPLRSPEGNPSIEAAADESVPIPPGLISGRAKATTGVAAKRAQVAAAAAVAASDPGAAHEPVVDGPQGSAVFEVRIRQPLRTPATRQVKRRKLIVDVDADAILPPVSTPATGAAGGGAKHPASRPAAAAGGSGGGGGAGGAHRPAAPAARPVGGPFRGPDNIIYPNHLLALFKIRSIDLPKTPEALPALLKTDPEPWYSHVFYTSSAALDIDIDRLNKLLASSPPNAAALQQRLALMTSRKRVLGEAVSSQQLSLSEYLANLEELLLVELAFFKLLKAANLTAAAQVVLTRLQASKAELTRLKTQAEAEPPAPAPAPVPSTPPAPTPGGAGASPTTAAPPAADEEPEYPNLLYGVCKIPSVSDCPMSDEQLDLALQHDPEPWNHTSYFLSASAIKSEVERLQGLGGGGTYDDRIAVLEGRVDSIAEAFQAGTLSAEDYMACLEDVILVNMKIFNLLKARKMVDAATVVLNRLKTMKKELADMKAAAEAQ